MLRRDEVTSKVRVTDLIVGEPVQLLITQSVLRPDGKARSITQKVRVLDAQLASRLAQEVRPGDEIQVTIVTEWTDSSYSTHVCAYCLIDNGS
jgi:hypothetical protein